MRVAPLMAFTPVVTASQADRSPPTAYILECNRYLHKYGFASAAGERDLAMIRKAIDDGDSATYCAIMIANRRINVFQCNSAKLRENG